MGATVGAGEVHVECGVLPIARLTAAVTRACDLVEDAAEPTVVVLRLGGGPAGGEGWPGPVGVAAVNRWERALRRLERLPAATVAVAAGHCGGSALELLLAADHRIAGADLRLSLPGTGGQLWPGMALYRLATRLGVGRARQLLLCADPLGAAGAHGFGLVDELAGAGAGATVGAAVAAAVTRLRRIAGAELAIRRQLLLEAPATSFEEALGTHLAACDRQLRRGRTNGC